MYKSSLSDSIVQNAAIIYKTNTDTHAAKEKHLGIIELT